MSVALWLALALSAPPPVAGPASATDQARALTRRSILEYNQGEYVQALADIEQAYELDPRPALSFNVGQCQRALGHHREAALAFKSYLRDVPNAPNREKAAALVVEMERLAREDVRLHRREEAGLAGRRAEAGGRSISNEPKPAPVVVVSAAPVPVAPVPAPAALPPAPEGAVTASEPTHHIPAAAWWLGGAGILVAAGGTVLFALAESTMSGDHPTQVDGVTQHQLTPSTFYTAATEGNVGEGLWAGGGALLVSGVIVALTGGSK